MNLENLLFLEDRLQALAHLHTKEPSATIEACEDWWDVVRQDTALFEVYVSPSQLDPL